MHHKVASLAHPSPNLAHEYVFWSAATTPSLPRCIPQALAAPMPTSPTNFLGFPLNHESQTSHVQQLHASPSPQLHNHPIHLSLPSTPLNPLPTYQPHMLSPVATNHPVHLSLPSTPPNRTCCQGYTKPASYPSCSLSRACHLWIPPSWL